MSDRTGELCPFCKKGKLYPTGKRGFVEPARKPKSGQTRGESTEYECDNCKRRTGGHGTNMAGTLTPTAETKVIKKTKEKAT